nr:hypothetical protein [Tanacetum cinerariifolium]
MRTNQNLTNDTLLKENTHQAADDVADVVAADVVAHADIEPTPPPPTPPPPPPQELPSTSQRVEHLEQDKIAQALEITKLKQRVKRLEKKNKLKDTSKQGVIIKLIDADEDVTLEEVDIAKDAKVAEDADVQRRLEESQAQVYYIDLEHADKVLSMQNDKPEPAELKELEEEESKALKRKSESHEEKAAKKQKLDEEVEELKKHLQIVPNDEDDVYTEATHLALKIVQDRFASSKPKNFLDDFLLTTLKSMFEKPDVEAQFWKNQRGIHGLEKVKSWRLLESYGVHIITFTTTQMILLVERRYPLTRFTLDQMLNNVRLEVEEESEVSLELLRFVRRQQQEGYRPE